MVLNILFKIRYYMGFQFFFNLYINLFLFFFELGGYIVRVFCFDVNFIVVYKIMFLVMMIKVIKVFIQRFIEVFFFIIIDFLDVLQWGEEMVIKFFKKYQSYF